MSDNEIQAQPAPEAATTQRDRRTAAEAPTVDVSPPVAPAPEAAAAPAPAAEPPPARTRRPPSGPVLVPFDSALPGVTSADIRAELARREKRVPTLMAERDQILQRMEAIEDALESIGEDVLWAHGTGALGRGAS